MSNTTVTSKEIYKRFRTSVYPKYIRPIIETMTPEGKNVTFTMNGHTATSNDGYAIAQQMNPEHPIDKMIFDVIRSATLRTNTEAGDGTTTSILLASALYKAFNGASLAEISKIDNLIKYAVSLIKNYSIDIKSNEELQHRVAVVSAGGNEDIAKTSLEAIKLAGVDGIIAVDKTTGDTDVVEGRRGFVFDAAQKIERILVNKTSLVYDNAYIFITDKKLYYEEEIVAILSQVPIKSTLVIIAPDFIGKTSDTLLANHLSGRYNIVTIKCDDSTTLGDLSLYVCGRDIVFKDVQGSIRDNLQSTNFHVIDSIYVDKNRSVIQSSNNIEDLVETLRNQLKEAVSDDEQTSLKKRISNLMGGYAAIYVSGATMQERLDRLYRYEDTTSAIRVALRDGVVIGGGVTLKNVAAFIDGLDHASIGVIAVLNTPYYYINTILHGYSRLRTTCNMLWYAITGSLTGRVAPQIEDRMKNIVDPTKVTILALENGWSAARALLTTNYMIKENGINTGNNN